ncbi:MAG: hypothetical protein ACD_79C00572G0001 [uncultured bacterium]|nr:MAG: hypothetical protein ACD_79C00572G0001 [uncultured bacterium]
MNVEKDKINACRALENLRMRLLDLTNRNLLINFRHSKTGSLRIIDELPDQLAATLLAEKEMSFFPIPEPTRYELLNAGYIEIDEETGQEIQKKKNPTAEEWAKYLKLSTSYEVPKPSKDQVDKKHNDSTIQTLFYPYELESKLKKLHQSSDSAIQEMGANILYLSFGFLEWFEKNNDSPHLAPLFLMPVNLHKGRLNPKNKTYEYTVSYSGEDIISNLSLREKLRVDFGMVLPELDANTNPESYFIEVQDMITENQPKWRVLRYISIGILNFSKLLMYLDLDVNRWKKDESIVDHPVVYGFLSGYNPDKKNDESLTADFGFGKEHLIDEIRDIHNKFPLIDDADSSQHSALIDAINGKNLVIEGPPGTGKSQTITNLIASAMMHGKKILFVAEKLAALEVVRRRLDAAGLGDFCLELHSHKSQKRKVLDEIQKRINNKGRNLKPREIEVEIGRYEELKNILKNHVERLNKEWKKTGKTLHEIFMSATRYREMININPILFHPEGYSGNNFDISIQHRSEDQIVTLRKVYQGVANQLKGDAILQNHPWYGVSNSNLQIFDIDRVKKILVEWQNSLNTVNEERKKIAEIFNCDFCNLPNSLSGLDCLLIDLESIPQLNGDEQLDVLQHLQGDVLDNTQKLLNLFEDIQLAYALLEKRIGRNVLHDLSSVERFVIENTKLNNLVANSVKVSVLIDTLNQMYLMKDQISEIEDPLKEIQSTLDKDTNKNFLLNESGLKEFKIFMNLFAELDSQYWVLRDKLYDNEQLDDLLPKLHVELEEFKKLNKELNSIFKLDVLPCTVELLYLKSILEAGGIFCWFKSSWRKARKKVLSFAVNKKSKFSFLKSFLDKIAEFVDRKIKFEENNWYKKELGPLLKGIDTDIEKIESIRSWYKKIRTHYGIGFGKKVLIGNTLINLSDDLVRGLRSLKDRNIQNQLNSILENLENLKKIFSPVSILKNDSKILVGKDGIINYLITSVEEALENCDQLLANKAMSILELSENINSLNTLKLNINKWNDADLENKYFNGRLGLKIGLDVDNKKAISAFRNTLSLADFIINKIKNKIVKQRIYSNPLIETFELLRSYSEKLRLTINIQLKKYNDFIVCVTLVEDDWNKNTNGNIENLIHRNIYALENCDTFTNWLDYVRVREQVVKMGFLRIVEKLEECEINISQVDDAYKSGIYDLLAREILQEDPELGRFSGHSQEAIQEKFKEYDNRLKKLHCRLIAWKIDQKETPSGRKGARIIDYTDNYLLQNECEKKTRHLPIRQLIEKAGDALVSLKPCFMMGPMSVAQYLVPGKIKFDLVIMDEASQIKPQDALGAIARGNQLVVVGDSKQLPPTSFFDRILDGDDDDQFAIEDSESILDATRSMFASRRLRWHYRSQHESLIAFSNNFFYENDLVLFPSPNKSNGSYGINFSRVTRGYFVNRRNIEEAKIISEAVREHLKKRPEESLGVVAMNSEQRLLIEQAIEMLEKEDLIFQQMLEKDASRQEPLFIKNLENVQGDERDVIFISMTYGPQEPGGRVFQRFGPINSDIGWRRLNVLFTRSKKRMHVFSSLGSNDILIESTSKRGVKALHDFIRYCETGIIPTLVKVSERGPDSDFEISVMRALNNEGFECVSQVGVAGFFIDVAVIDSENPSRYLMGIECDGATYHSAKSVRDRDRLRQAILERLGWRIRRIWSTDWFKNPQAEIQTILRELKSLKTNKDKDIFVKKMTETEEIKEIIDEVDKKDLIINEFISEKENLKENLLEFDKKIIRKAVINIPENQRILRTSMLESLLENLPCNKSEYLEFIPPYLRNETNSQEEMFLDYILALINLNAENIRKIK